MYARPDNGLQARQRRQTSLHAARNEYFRNARRAYCEQLG